MTIRHRECGTVLGDTNPYQYIGTQCPNCEEKITSMDDMETTE